MYRHYRTTGTLGTLAIFSDAISYLEGGWNCPGQLSRHEAPGQLKQVKCPKCPKCPTMPGQLQLTAR